MSVVICSSTVLKELVKTLPECPTVQVVILMDAALNCTEVGSNDQYQEVFFYYFSLFVCLIIIGLRIVWNRYARFSSSYEVH